MDRQETTRRFKLLQARIADGKVHVAEHLRENFQRSFARVRKADDGLIDEASLDGTIRTSLLAAAYVDDRQEWKDAVSLRRIQEQYFELLSQLFGSLYELMTDAKATPYRFAAWFISDQTRVDKNASMFDEFVDRIKQFWADIAEPTWIHLEDSQDTKAVFAGELFPDGQNNLVSSTGIYFDTTILPDPFLKMASMLARVSANDRVEEVLRLGLQAMAYRDLALADVAVPLVAVLPDRHSLEENYQELVGTRAASDAVKHASLIFGRQFEDVEELAQFLKKFRSSTEIAKALVRPQELVFDTQWQGSSASNIDRHIKENGKLLGVKHPGQAVYVQLLTRFSQANDAFQRSQDLHATPVVRAETSWLWYNWMLRSKAQATDPAALTAFHVTRALGSTVKTEMSWLGNVPAAALIEIRRVGALEEIRSLLSEGIQELVEARPENFHRTGDRVFENLHAAFEDHERKVESLKTKKWKFAGLDVGSFVVIGAIEMAAALTGNPAYGAAAASASMIGVTPNIKDLKGKFRDLKTEHTALNATGVGILFKVRK